jgi:hypothetical protein
MITQAKDYITAIVIADNLANDRRIGNLQGCACEYHDYEYRLRNHWAESPHDRERDALKVIRYLLSIGLVPHPGWDSDKYVADWVSPSTQFPWRVSGFFWGDASVNKRREVIRKVTDDLVSITEEIAEHNDSFESLTHNSQQKIAEINNWRCRYLRLKSKLEEVQFYLSLIKDADNQ